jgi:hypothetical protein
VLNSPHDNTDNLKEGKARMKSIVALIFVVALMGAVIGIADSNNQGNNTQGNDTDQGCRSGVICGTICCPVGQHCSTPFNPTMPCVGVPH